MTPREASLDDDINPSPEWMEGFRAGLAEGEAAHAASPDPLPADARSKGSEPTFRDVSLEFARAVKCWVQMDHHDCKPSERKMHEARIDIVNAEIERLGGFSG